MNRETKGSDGVGIAETYFRRTEKNGIDLRLLGIYGEEGWKRSSGTIDHE